MYRVESVNNIFMQSRGAVLDVFSKNNSDLVQRRSKNTGFVIGEVDSMSVSVRVINDDTGEILNLSSESKIREFMKKNSVLGSFISDKIYVCSVSQIASKMIELLEYDGNFDMSELGLNYEFTVLHNPYMLYADSDKCALDVLIRNVKKFGGLDNNKNFNVHKSIVRVIDSRFYVLDSNRDKAYTYTITDKKKFLNLLTKGIVLIKDIDSHEFWFTRHSRVNRTSIFQHLSSLNNNSK